MDAHRRLIMGGAAEDREKAARLPKGDVIGILYEQHAQVLDLFERVENSSAEARQEAFDELIALLVAHETAEQEVLRPVTRETAGDDVVQARLQEEKKANQAIAELKKLDVSSSEFDRMFADFKQAVVDHAEHEETDEFPTVLEERDEDERRVMGERLSRAEATASTR
ncbi:MAG: hemerythrin domain-containing protein [Candidatus Dormiibacterota bacterium]